MFALVKSLDIILFLGLFKVTCYYPNGKSTMTVESRQGICFLVYFWGIYREYMF